MSNWKFNININTWYFNFYIQTCFSIKAASSKVALGMMPGSVKLVLNKEPITKQNKTPDMIGITGVTR